MKDSLILLSCGLTFAVFLIPLLLHYFINTRKGRQPQQIYDVGVNTIGSASKAYAIGNLSRYFILIGLFALMSLAMYFLLQWVHLHNRESLIGILTSLILTILLFFYGRCIQTKNTKGQQ